MSLALHSFMKPLPPPKPRTRKSCLGIAAFQRTPFSSTNDSHKVPTNDILILTVGVYGICPTSEFVMHQLLLMMMILLPYRI